MSSGPQIVAAKFWLSTSFEGLMRKIWKEFPKQKLALDPVTQRPIFLHNYLNLSRRPRYRKFFFNSNNVLRH